MVGWSSDVFILTAEIMDFGYPQNLSPEILKLYITQEGVRSPFSSKVWVSHDDLIGVFELWITLKNCLTDKDFLIFLWWVILTFSMWITKQTADKPVPNATLQVTGAVGWRREGLVYKKNEVVFSDYYCNIFCFLSIEVD